jgi:hypothetical protein
LAEARHGFAQQPVGVLFGVVEHAEPASAEFTNAWHCFP